MFRRVVCPAVFTVVLSSLLLSPAFAQDNPDVLISTGPTSELVRGTLQESVWSFASIFTTSAGFKPEEIALGGDGKLYVCNASSSEILRFDPASPEAGLQTLYARNSAVSPDPPEQPKGCTIAGDDLLFLSRNGRGGSAKTGLWAIRNVTGPTPGEPVLLKGLDSVGGISGQGLAINFDGRVFFTFGNEVWVATPKAGAGQVDADAAFERWAFTAGEGFGIAAKGVPDATGSLQAQVFVASSAGGVVEVLQEQVSSVEDPLTGLPVIVRSGTKSGCLDIDVADRPNAVEFDGSGDLWVAVSSQSNGRRGAVYEVNDPRCGMAPSLPVLRGDELSGAVGIALTPTGSEPVTLTFPPGEDKSNTVNLCSSTFNLDQVTLLCQDTWTVSCRLMPQAEFEARTDFEVGDPAGNLGDVVQQDFSFTSCADFPGASGNCTEIRIKESTDAGICTEADIINILANWQFYSLADLDHPGLLYAPGDFPTDVGGNPLPESSPFSENILVDFDPLPVPADPLDPRATGSRDAWGSGLVVVEDAPNRPPVAVLEVTPEVAQCGAPVTLDGAGSFDNDWNVDHRDSVTNWAFSVDGVLQQSAMIDFYVFDTTGLSAGTYTALLEVEDEGWDVNGPLSDSVEATFEVLADEEAPVISRFELEDLGDPRVAIDDAGNAVMWPPNHEMVAFKALYDAYDACQANCSLIISSNEPANGTGDGDVGPDFAITGQSAEAFFFDLRAERAQNGTGRAYTIRLQCGDGTHTTSSDPITVFVPSSQSGT